MAKTSYQILKVLLSRYFNSFNNNSLVNLFGEKKKNKMKLSGANLFLWEYVGKKGKKNVSQISSSLPFS